MARLFVARAKLRFYVAGSCALIVAATVFVAGSQPSAAQNGNGTAYSFDSTPTSIPNVGNQKKSWTQKVGGAWSSGWNKTTGAFKKLVPKKKPKKPKNDPARLSSKSPPLNADLHASMAQLHMEKGRNDVALKHLEQAFKLDPKNMKATRSYGRYLERQGQVAEAEKRFRRATETEPGSPGAWNDFGMCLARQGKRGEAVRAIERAVQLRPNKTLYRNNVSVILVELGDNKRALGHLAKAHGEAKAHYNLGVLMSKKGDKKAAEMHFRQALAKDGSLVAAHQWLESLNGPRQGERVAQRPLDVRRPIAAPMTRPVVTQPPRPQPTPPHEPTAADKFWGGSSNGTHAPRNQPAPRPHVVTPTRPAFTPPQQQQPVRVAPATQPQQIRNNFAERLQAQAPIRVAPAKPSNGQTAEDQFWGKPTLPPTTQQSPPVNNFAPRIPPQAPVRVTPTQPSGQSAADQFWGAAPTSSQPAVQPRTQLPSPSTQIAPPVRSQFEPPRSTAAVAPPTPTPAKTLPSQHFQPYKLGSPPSPGPRPSFVSDPRFAPKPPKKYKSPLKFGKQATPYRSPTDTYAPSGTNPYR